jgi:signal transduction histidine kinase
VEVAAEQTERLIRLAEDLLVLDRDEREAPRLARFDLVELAEQARQAAPAGPHPRPVDITVDAPARPAPVSSDPDRIRRALDNVLVNALRFSPDGGQIRIAAGAVDGYAELTVTDQGPGFPPDFLPVAFERFRRHDPARTRIEQEGRAGQHRARPGDRAQRDAGAFGHRHGGQSRGLVRGSGYPSLADRNGVVREPLGEAGRSGACPCTGSSSS